MRLARRHPEILKYLREVANERKRTAEALKGENSARKPRAAAARIKQDSSESL